MPASTSDPIASVLQRSFSGMDSGGHRREGLMRGGNSASVGSTSLDLNIQASAQRSLLLSNGKSSNDIQFDNPVRYSSGSGLKQPLSGPSKPRMIILNPRHLEKSSKSEITKNGEETKAVTIPKPKVRNLRSCVKVK